MMRELALQAVQGSNSADDRAALDAEVQQLKAEIDRVSESTSFNAQNILDGTFNRLFQIGDQAGDTIRIGLGSVDTASLGWPRRILLTWPMCLSLRVSRARFMGPDQTRLIRDDL